MKKDEKDSTPGGNRADPDMARLLEVLERITAQATVEDICRSVVEGVREVMGFERTGLFLWDESAAGFRGTYGTDLEGRTTFEHHLMLPGGPDSPEERVRQGSPIERGCRIGQPLPRPGEENVTADMIGLQRHGATYGLLCVDNRISRGPVSERDLQHVKLIGHVLGNALETARAREALARSEERFRQVSENSREWIWELDERGRYSFSNPVVETILGYAPAEVLGRRPADLAAPEEGARLEAHLRETLEKDRPPPALTHRARRKDGSWAVLETSSLPMRDKTGQPLGCRGAHRDITREHDLEHQLRYSQKMEAIGRLAGGIAHDFNNLLTAILGGINLMAENMSPEDPLLADVGRIRRAGERAAHLTRQLLTFSHSRAEHAEHLQINEIILAMEPLLRRTLGERVELMIVLEPDPPALWADPDHLQQMLMHLAVNARDAMTDPHFLARSTLPPERRAALFEQARARTHRLTLRTDTLRLDRDFHGRHDTLKAGVYIRLSAEDTGVGLTREALEHLFEPFFTTREVGQGSGLGLSTLYGIVRKMGGLIEAEGEEGRGAKMQVYLPASKREAKPAAAPKTAAAAGRETVLLAEDNDIVRDLTVRMLRQLGYEVLDAPDGQAALELGRRHEGPLHLVLTDMVMPRMDGKQLVEGLRLHRKDFKALFISGYNLTETVEGRALGPDMPLVHKPFTKEALAGKIREVLDGP